MGTSRRWVKRSLVFLGVLLTVGYLGRQLVVLVLLGPPDTFDDMWRQLSKVPVPADFEQVETQANGLRSRFAAAAAPFVSHAYSAEWGSGELCDRIQAIAESLGDTQPATAGQCGYRVKLPSGWRARLVNVWSYGLTLYAVAPDHVTSLSEDQCADAKARYEESILKDTYLRYGPCWVEPGHALVTYLLHGKVGW